MGYGYYCNLLIGRERFSVKLLVSLLVVDKYPILGLSDGAYGQLIYEVRPFEMRRLV